MDEKTGNDIKEIFKTDDVIPNKEPRCVVIGIGNNDICETMKVIETLSEKHDIKHSALIVCDDPYEHNEYMSDLLQKSIGEVFVLHKVEHPPMPKVRGFGWKRNEKRYFGK